MKNFKELKEKCKEIYTSSIKSLLNLGSDDEIKIKRIRPAFDKIDVDTEKEKLFIFNTLNFDRTDNLKVNDGQIKHTSK